MHALEVVRILSREYGFDYSEALVLSGLIDDNKTNTKKDDNNNIPKQEKTIKPFDGIVKQNCCKAVVYNHGLYTQCTNETNNEFCSSLCKKIKYGHINTRKDYPVGTYVLANGKREVKYERVKKRLKGREKEEDRSNRIIREDSDEERELLENKNRRGRPRMIKKEIEINRDTSEIEESEEEYEEVGVKREIIEGKEYLISSNNIVYDNKSYKIIGRLILGKIKDL